MACLNVLCPKIKGAWWQQSQHISWCKHCKQKIKCDPYKKAILHQEQYKDYLTILDKDGSYSIIGKLIY